MHIKALIAATALVALIPLAANAGEVQNRIHNEQGRIDQGARSGSLTHAEYRGVEARLHAIQLQRNRDLRANDGHLTAREGVRLNREENRLSGRIYVDKHNLARQ